MGKYPVLKPREVIAILENSASWKCAKEARTGNIGIQTVGIPPYLFIRGEIFHQFCYGKSPKILDWMWKSCSGIDEAGVCFWKMRLTCAFSRRRFAQPLNRCVICH